MKIQMSFKHIPHSPEVEEWIEKKSQKLEKHFGQKTELKWVLYRLDGGDYAEVDALGPNFKFHARAQGENLYKSCELALGKLEKQLHKKKDKKRNRMHTKKKTELKILEPEDAWSDYDEDKFDDVA